MAVYTYEIATDISLPNITVYRRLKDGELTAYRLTANEEYVMYNTASDFTHIDEEGNEYERIEYYRQATISKSVPVEDWTWVAVPEADIPADQIYGLVKPPTETI